MASPLISYAEAAEQVHLFILALAEASATPGHSVSLEIVPLTAAAGRVLAAPIRADRDQPPFPRSTRDGFACRTAEANSHQLLFRAGQVRAGETASGSLGTGEVWEIMTGAPVPEGADAVFMVEHADQNPGVDQNPDAGQNHEFVRLAAARTIQSGENIVPRAAEARTGDLLISRGTRIGPAQIALAAQCGYHELTVAPKPRVAILSTGDELVPIESVPGPSQIRNSNAPMLAALVTAAGGIPVALPAVPDQDAALDAALFHALDADLLLVTGGISAGRFDLVEDAVTRMGARFFFGGVAIQPGKPIVFGQLPRLGQTPLPFFALPGNPISSAVTFHLFAAPLLAALSDDTAPQPRFALAHLAGNWNGKPGLTRFLPAHCDFGPTPEVRLIPWQGSGDLAAFARSNCLLVIPAEAQEIPDGNPVQILLT
jgi:molybdopterin molybdotransferase